MIGARQQGTTGPITLTGLPWACPSFCGRPCHPADAGGKAGRQPRRPAAGACAPKQAPFGLGSDHFILSDPAVGVPCPMLGQWPDAFYHTSSDTLERLDLDVLRYSTLVAAGYLYTLASFTLQDAQLVWNHQRTRLMAEAERIRREGFDQGGDGQQTERRLAALKTFLQGAAASVQRFAPGADPGPQLAWMDAALPGAFARHREARCGGGALQTPLNRWKICCWTSRSSWRWRGITKRSTQTSRAGRCWKPCAATTSTARARKTR